jgi:hypothetical protein
LLHSLWQGALIAAILFFALRIVPARHHDWRYRLSAGSLLLLVPGATRKPPSTSANQR